MKPVKLAEEEKTITATGEGFLRCCFATSLDKIEEATIRIARFVKSIKAG